MECTILINNLPFRFVLWHGTFPINETYPIIIVPSTSVDNDDNIFNIVGSSHYNLTDSFLFISIGNAQNIQLHNTFIDTIDKSRSSKGLLCTVDNRLDIIPYMYDLDQFMHVPIGLIDPVAIPFIHYPSPSPPSSSHSTTPAHPNHPAHLTPASTDHTKDGDDNKYTDDCGSGQRLEATILGYDENKFNAVYSSPWYCFATIVTTLMFAGNVILSAYLLLLYLRKCSFTLSVFCLVFEIIANVLRMLKAALLPFAPTVRLLHIYLLATLPFPFSITSKITLLFFWLQLTSQTLIHTDFVSALKFPAVAVCVAVFMVELINNALRITISYDYVTVASVIYFVIYAALAVLFFLTAYRMWNFTNETGFEPYTIRCISICIMLSGSCIMLGVLCCILFIFVHIWLSVLCWFMLDLFIMLNSFFQLIIFYLVKKNQRSDSEGMPPIKVDHGTIKIIER